MSLLIDLLAKEKREMQFTEIAKALDWPKSTVHGLLASLQDCQYIEQCRLSGRYKLGVRLFELGNIVARGWDIRTAAMPHLQRLGKELEETVHLATDVDGEVLYIEKLDYAQGFHVITEIGVRLPMHCSGLGKVLLAYKSILEVKRIIELRGLNVMTVNTITNADRLLRELEYVRARGYAIDNCEIMEGLFCIAAPVKSRDGEIKYAVSVSSLVRNITDSRLEMIIRQIMLTAGEISYSMGYRE